MNIPTPFWFICKNARICSDVFLTELLDEVSEIQWDVVCLSETWGVDGNYTLTDGHRLFCCRDEFRFSGVAIFLNARWVPYIIQFVKISDRVCYVDLLLNGTKYRIISVYFPHAGYDTIYFTACVDHLRKTLFDGQRDGYKCMIGGDFNTE